MEKTYRLYGMGQFHKKTVKYQVFFAVKNAAAGIYNKESLDFIKNRGFYLLLFSILW